MCVLPLYGELDAAAQDAALRPSPAGRRKIVLATSIAETSLTIEGVRVVVDAGLRRYAQFDPATGMSRLETGKVSQAAADQRRGRAGRLAPGRVLPLVVRGRAGDARRTDAARDPACGPRTARARARLLGRRRTPARLRWLDPPPAGARSPRRAICCATLGRDRRAPGASRRMAARSPPWALTRDSRTC